MHIDSDLCVELVRKHNTMSHQYTEMVATNNSIDHGSRIVDLDHQKFRIAKAASDAEIEGGRLEQELESLKNRLHELGVQGIEGDDIARARREVEDPTMYGISKNARNKLTKICRLKLKVFRSLGIDVETDGSGTYNKAVIRNSAKGDVHVVNIDPKFSRYWYSNYFWQKMQ